MSDLRLFPAVEDAEYSVNADVTWGIEDAVLDAEDSKEIAAMEAELETQYSIAATAEQNVAALEAMIDTEANIAAAGSVSKDAAILGIQNTIIAANMFGIEADFVTSVGMEDAEADAVAALESSTSDKRGLLTKVLDGVKKLWMKIKKAGMKVVLKIVQVVGRREAKIDKLVKELGDVKDVKAEKMEKSGFFGGDKVEALAKKYGAYSMIKGEQSSFGSFFKIVSSQEIKFLEGDGFKKIGSLFADIIDNKDNVEEIAVKQTKKVTTEVTTHENKTGFNNPVTEKVTKDVVTALFSVGGSIDLSKIKDKLTDESQKKVESFVDSKGVLVRVTPGGVRVLAMVGVEGKGVVGAGLAYETLTFKKDAVDTGAFVRDVPKKKDVVKSLESMKKKVAAIKNGGKVVDTITEDVEKSFEEYSKIVSNYSATQQKMLSSYNTLIKKLYLTAPRVGFDYVMGMYYNVDSTIAAAGIYLSVAKGEKKEEEKNKDDK